MKNVSIIMLLLFVGFVACNQKSAKEGSKCCEKEELGVKAENFEKMVEGKAIKLFTLENKRGMKVQITNFGGRIVSIIVPDKAGKFGDVVQGYDNIDDYLADGMYQSGIIGRFGNRIKEGKFSINGENYRLVCNNAPNALHGGTIGFNKVIWGAKQVGNKLVLDYVSADMEEGFPGELTVKVTYELSEENELSMIYEATTTKPTVVNLTNHTHYNLKGFADTNVLDHALELYASKLTPVDVNLIPTGKLTDVTGTPFDFRKAKLLSKDIAQDDEQIKFGFGYDHNWVLDKEEGALALALTLSEASTGRVMKMYTTEPGMQVYTGNFMDGSVIGKAGKKVNYRSAIALEPQHYPDSPNQANFPTTLLNPGEKYYHKSVIEFTVK